MNSTDTATLLASLALLLWVARSLGELARRLGQAAILGELAAGILLGPTLLGRAAPDLSVRLFGLHGGPVGTFFAGFATLSALLLLFVAGFEVKLGTLRRAGAAAFWVSGAGIMLPFALGGLAAWRYPERFGFEAGGPHANPTIFALFFATAMSISALPVIAKTLLDLGIYHTRAGAVAISAALVDDIVGWTVFSVLLGCAAAPGGAPDLGQAGRALVGALAFALLMLTVGRWFFGHFLPWLRGWAGRVLSFCLGFALLGGAATEALGLHALFGAFITGMSLGSNPAFDEETQETVVRFVNSFFAPIFLAGLGLRGDFIADFRPGLVASVLVMACVGKIAGCGLAARLSGLTWREARVVGLSMNARGAMEILLGAVALEHGLIGKSLYVALIVTAIATSKMAGLLMPRGANFPTVT